MLSMELLKPFKELEPIKKKRLNINAIAIIILASIYFSAKYLLELNELAFMGITIKIFNYIFVSLSLSFIIQIVLILYKILRNKTENFKIRILAALGSALSFASLIVLFLYISVTIIFEIYPEHIVEKDGKKMVAYVDSFMEVNVDYYDYVNPIIRGKNKKISENYGNGDYDPFKQDKMPKLKWYRYYDDDGEVIKSSYKQIND